MTWFQKTIELRPKSRGFHIITSEIEQLLPELRRFRLGLAHLFIQHTSASLAINENADPTVRLDLENHFNVLAPENAPYLLHTYEGPDDMPAHIKAILVGPSLTIPITNGQFNMGIWQGIYLCEHRNRAGSRRIVASLQGDKL